MSSSVVIVLLLLAVVLMYAGSQMLNTAMFTNFYSQPNALPLFLTSAEAGPLMVGLASPAVKLSRNQYLKKVPGSCEWLVVYAGDAKTPPDHSNVGTAF